MSAIQLNAMPAKPPPGTAGRPGFVSVNMFRINSLPKTTICQYELCVMPEGAPPAVNKRVILRGLKENPLLQERPIAWDGGNILYCYERLEADQKITTLEVDLTNVREPRKPVEKSPRRSPSPGSKSPSKRTQSPSKEVVKPERPERKDASGRVFNWKFQIVIKLTTEIDMKDVATAVAAKTPVKQHTITALDIYLRQFPFQNMFTVGRNFFTIPDQISPLGSGLVSWIGYHQAIMSTEEGLTVAIDQANCAVWANRPLLEVICQLLEVRNPNEVRINNAKQLSGLRKLNKLKFQTIHMKPRPGKAEKEWVIHGFSQMSADQAVFDARVRDSTDQKPMTVADYFAERYGPLQFPHLPCVLTGPKNKEVMIPIEVCAIIPGQKYKGKLHGQQTAAMIKYAASKPLVRQTHIIAGATKHFGYQTSELLKKIDFSIAGAEMIKTEARLLNPPQLLYGGDKDQFCTPRDGVWNLRGKKLFQPAVVTSYAVCIVAGARVKEQAGPFMRMMESSARDLGITIRCEPPKPLYFPQPLEDVNLVFNRSIEQAREQYGKEPQFVLIIYYDEGDHRYEQIKYMGDCKYGVPTQVVTVKKIERPNPQYCANVWLKINAKLFGCNVSLTKTAIPQITEAPTMLIGADVSHPGFGEREVMPSIAALTGSLDPYCTRFTGVVSYQSPGRELIHIVDLKISIKTLLIRYYKANGKVKPAKIIFFRDGIDEGQFDQVRQTELAFIYEACNELEQGYRPLVSFVISLKRHHIRLFPAGGPSSADKSGNVHWGTVVDTKIVTPHLFDFYLQSCAGLQGTTRPTRYVVLHDDNKFNADTMQNLCWSLAHTYSRCTRAVKCVPPVYYAGLLAFRARLWIIGGRDTGDLTIPAPEFTSSGPNNEIVPMTSFDWCPNAQNKLASSMFFM